MSLRINDKELIYLDSKTVTAIFDCVYGINDYSKGNTKILLSDKRFEEFIKLLLAHQQYNYVYRPKQTGELFPLFESTVGPMEINSDGTTLWLALGLAIKELYGFRKDTLKQLLLTIKIRK